MNERNFARESEARYIKQVAEKLRSMAADVERVRIRDTKPGSTVADVVHIVMWGVANLHLDSLATNVDDIHEVDALIASEKSEVGS